MRFYNVCEKNNQRCVTSRCFIDQKSLRGCFIDQGEAIEDLSQRKESAEHGFTKIVYHRPKKTSGVFRRPRKNCGRCGQSVGERSGSRPALAPAAAAARGVAMAAHSNRSSRSGPDFGEARQGESEGSWVSPDTVSRRRS